MRIILIFILLSDCAKDYDFNPWTTVLKHIHKIDYADNTKIRNNN